MSGPAAFGVPGAGQRVSPWFLARVLLERRRLIVLLAVSCGLAAGLASVLTSRKYVASATFIPQEPKTPQSLISELAPQFGLSLGRANANSPDFYASLLRSKELLRDAVMAQYHVSSEPPFTGNLIAYFRIEASSPNLVMIMALRRMSDVVDVQTDRSTGVVGVDVTTDNPELSEQIAVRLLDLVNAYNLRRQQFQAKEEREFLEKRLDSAQGQLSAAEDTYSNFLMRNRRWEESPDLRGEVGRLERQVNLRQQLYVSLNQYYELAKLEEVRNTPVITVIQHPSGFVEPKRRGTPLKALAGLVLGALAGTLLALGAEGVRRKKGDGSREFVEFKASLDDARLQVRSWFRRRSA